MESESNKNTPDYGMNRNWEKEHQRGKVFGGLILITIGALFLAREMGVIIPGWIFSWKILLIVIGLYIGVKHSFKNFKWLIPIFIGSAFLVRDFYPEIIAANLIWPIVIIMFGIALLFKPRKKYDDNCWKKDYSNYDWRNKSWGQSSNSEDFLQIDSVFGSVQKNIISKDFKGGEINVVFGGAEINLSQSDILEKATLEINTVFGGTKLIVPANWEIKSELTAVLGGVEDKRFIQRELTSASNKILILKGSVVFGGIEIRSN